MEEFLNKLQYQPISLLHTTISNESQSQFKLYKNFNSLALSSTIPISDNDVIKNFTTDSKKLGAFLYSCYGVCSVNSQLIKLQSQKHEYSTLTYLRRGIASGGALYPNEVYVYQRNSTKIPQGVYHYDVAHHKLITLRLGNFDNYINNAIGTFFDPVTTELIVFITVKFKKNFHKYGNFSYRLDGLDTGILLGQILLVSDKLELNTYISYVFLDKVLNHLLGLKDSQESVYASIIISNNNPKRIVKYNQIALLNQDQLIKSLPPINVDELAENKSMLNLSSLQEIHLKCFIEKLSIENQKNLTTLEYNTPSVLYLEFIKNFDILKHSKERISPGYNFIDKQVSLETLLKVLNLINLSISDITNDLNIQLLDSIKIYAYLNKVNSLEKGIYIYNSKTLKLQLLRKGNFSEFINKSTTRKNFNFRLLPICLHLTAPKKLFTNKFGMRGYRITHMLSGIIAHRIQLLSLNFKLGCHFMMSFDAKNIDTLYELKNETTLIQIAIGYYSPPTRLIGYTGA